jgi:hypothetical protein
MIVPAAALQPMAEGAIRRSVDARPNMAATGLRDLPAYQFQDNGALATRLAGMRSLAVMTVWRSRRNQLYLGVDEKGRAGLHFSQFRGVSAGRALWERHPAADRGTPRETPTAALRTVSP